MNIKRLLKVIRKALSELTPIDLRLYLTKYLNKATYANQIKSMRVFFRDFHRTGQVVESFTLPQNGYMPKVIPSKAKLQTFYGPLDELRDQALFLMFATSGLRKAEVLS